MSSCVWKCQRCQRLPVFLSVVCFKYRTSFTSTSRFIFTGASFSFLKSVFQVISVETHSKADQCAGQSGTHDEEEHCNRTRHDTENVQFRQHRRCTNAHVLSSENIRGSDGSAVPLLYCKRSDVAPRRNIPSRGCSRVAV